MNKLKEKSDSNLNEIITRYISYQPEMVEAALFESVDRGIISYGDKELLLRQIETNFTFHGKFIKNFGWESDNAFVKYVSRYQDEEIYDLIEDPREIAIDVYHAVLLAAKDRELISEGDFAHYYNEAKKAIRSEEEVRNDEIDEFVRDVFPLKDSIIDSERDKYWICPTCRQMVSMDLGVCWNCQSEIPSEITHPDKEEIIKELTYGSRFSPVKCGLMITGVGIFIGLCGLPWADLYHGIWYGRLVFGAFFIILGIMFVGYGLVQKSKEKNS